jgi:hypothetical protein
MALVLLVAGAGGVAGGSVGGGRGRWGWEEGIVQVRDLCV